MESFAETDIYTDLANALSVEHYHQVYLYTREIVDKDQRFYIANHPPSRRPRCWCPENSPVRCQTWTDNCHHRPKLQLGRGFDFVKCPDTNDHGPDNSARCAANDCFRLSDCIPDWLRLVMFAQAQQGRETRLPEQLEDRVRRYIRAKYDYTSLRTDIYTNVLCVIIENLHDPSRRMNLTWMCDVNGVLY